MRWVELSTVPHLELSTQASELFHEFFSLLLVAADLIQREQRDPLDAIIVSLRRWRQLLARVEVLSEEAQVGLFGEVWLLRRLLRANGGVALEQWVGPRDEPHDFRLGQEEIEVKTTRSASRVHTIHGLHQLEPGGAAASYSLTAAFASRWRTWESIPDLVAEVRDLLVMTIHDDKRWTIYWRRAPDTPIARRPLWSPLSDPHTTNSRTVDLSCPRITSTNVHWSTPAVRARVDSVTYRINLEGLGFSDGSPEFLRLIP